MIERLTTPITLDLPEGITYPPALTAANKKQVEAFAHWVTAEANYNTALAALEIATAADTRLLIAAVADNKPHPGTINGNKAKLEFEYAVEAERQANTTFGQVREAVEVALAAAAVDLIPQAVAAARNGVEQYDTLVTAITDQFAGSGRDLAASYDTLRLIAPYLADKVRYRAEINDTPTLTISRPISVAGNVEAVAGLLAAAYPQPDAA